MTDEPTTEPRGLRVGDPVRVCYNGETIEEGIITSVDPWGYATFTAPAAPESVSLPAIIEVAITISGTVNHFPSIE